jgi:hypothetical protein
MCALHQGQPANRSDIEALRQSFFDNLSKRFDDVTAILSLCVSANNGRQQIGVHPTHLGKDPFMPIAGRQRPKW